jgi:hypothetical protein
VKGVENELEEVKDAFGASKLCIGGENARRGLTTSDVGQKWLETGVGCRKCVWGAEGQLTVVVDESERVVRSRMVDSSGKRVKTRAKGLK